MHRFVPLLPLRTASCQRRPGARWLRRNPLPRKGCLTKGIWAVFRGTHSDGRIFATAALFSARQKALESCVKTSSSAERNMLVACAGAKISDSELSVQWVDCLTLGAPAACGYGGRRRSRTSRTGVWCEQCPRPPTWRGSTWRLFLRCTPFLRGW